MKTKSATCSTGHGTGVAMPLDLAVRLKQPHVRLRLFSRLKPSERTRRRERAIRKLAAELEGRRIEAAKRRHELGGLKSLETQRKGSGLLGRLTRFFSRAQRGA